MSTKGDKTNKRISDQIVLNLQLKRDISDCLNVSNRMRKIQGDWVEHVTPVHLKISALINHLSWTQVTKWICEHAIESLWIFERAVASPRRSCLAPISSWLEKTWNLNERRGAAEWGCISEIMNESAPQTAVKALFGMIQNDFACCWMERVAVISF